jgi:CDP-diacylglycerol---serine O-phosphatidyltransferase
MNVKGIIPNALTMANLICGSLATVQILLYGNVILAVELMVLGAIFDFGDGLAARLLGVAGPLGKQLDSLADMVTFGLVPALLACSLMPNFGENKASFVPLIIVVASAYRLGKFNLDENQSDQFIGLATPANAMFWGSVAGIYHSYDGCLTDVMSSWFHQGSVIVALAFLFSWLMISPVKLLAFKFKKGQTKPNRDRLVLMGLCVGIYLILFTLTKNPWVGVPFVLLLYFVYSTIINSLNTKQ